MNIDKLVILLQTVISAAPQLTLLLVAFGLSVVSIILLRIL